MSDLKQRIDEGLLGKYEGLSNGFKRLNKIIFGVQRKCNTLIGANSGAGKTTLVDFILSNAMQDAKAKKVKLDVFYFSYEIDKVTKQCNMLSNIIYNKYGITIAPEKIKGLGNNRLTKDEQDLIYSEIPTMEEMFSKINFTFKPENPTGMYFKLWQHGKANGRFIYEPYKAEDGTTKQKIVKFIPNDPDWQCIVVLDHLSLMSLERGFSVKENIDKWSEYCVELKNQFGYSFFNISQFNDSLSSVDRSRLKGVDLSPQQSDFKNTRNPYDDADIVIGLMNPYKLDMNECLKYRLKEFKSNFIMLKVIKNRLSVDNTALGILFNPKAGTFLELPPASEMTDDSYREYMNKLNN
jgi:replicative DNA helicase